VLVHLADEEQSCVVDGRRGGGECRSVVSRVADSQASRVASVAVMMSEEQSYVVDGSHLSINKTH
jgi:hypothetical protein